MNIKEFLYELEGITAHYRTWSLVDGQITSNDQLCPIHEVWMHSDLNPDGGLLEDYGQEGEALGLRSDTVHKIAAAADGRGFPKMRQKLLKACGLKDPTP